MSRIEGDYVIRFDRHIRLQHIVLMASFVVLSLTGLPQAFPNGPSMNWWLQLFGGIENLRLVHHWAARAFYLTYFYHLFYLGFAWLRQKRSAWTILPTVKDMKDAFQSMLHIFGLAPEPVYEHMQYGQKIDYWFTMIVVPVMAVSGITIGNEFILGILPGWAVAIAVVSHRGLAVLSIGFVVMVHFYYGHLAPRAFPFNPVIFTGKMKKEKYREWFYLEYLRLEREEAERPTEKSEILISKSPPLKKGD